MRPTRDEALMAQACIIAQRSTCDRAHVGVVISRDGRPLVSGYNGAPSGMPHCQHSADEPCLTAVHAEANAIAFAARWGVGLQSAELFTTWTPCLACAQLIINTGIARVVWGTPYHRDNTGLPLLEKAGLELAHIGVDWDDLHAI